MDASLFQLNFNPPQNFAAYRQSELDTARVNTFQAMEQFPYISKRFALERFLGLTEEEITKNEKLWQEEHNKDLSEEPKGSDLRSIGVSSSDIIADEETGEDLTTPPEEPGLGPENVTAPVGSAQTSPGGAAPPAAPAGPAA